MKLMDNYLLVTSYYQTDPPGFIVSKERSQSSTTKYIVEDLSNKIKSENKILVGDIVNVFKSSAKPIYIDGINKQLYIINVNDIVSID